jgi:hypothetical protein
MILTDVIGSLRVNSPEEAIDLQLPIGLDSFSDGQGYCFMLQDANLPFLLDGKLKPLLPCISVTDHRGHRIVKLRDKLKAAVDPSKSLVTQWFESAAKHVKANKGDLQSLKFTHPMPLTILNTFSIKSVQDVYGSSQDELLWDIQEQFILPVLEYLRSRYPLQYFQGDDVAIFDGDIHGPLVDEEFSVIEGMSKRCQKWEIRFACYAPDVPLPRNMLDPWKPEMIRRRLLKIPGTVSWMFFYEGESEEDFEKKLRFIQRHREESVTLAIGLLDSNREHYEDIHVLGAQIKRTIEFLDLSRLHISPTGGFKGVEPNVAERKMQMLVDLKSMVEGTN